MPLCPGMSGDVAVPSKCPATAPVRGVQRKIRDPPHGWGRTVDLTAGKAVSGAAAKDSDQLAWRLPCPDPHRPNSPAARAARRRRAVAGGLRNHQRRHRRAGGCRRTGRAHQPDGGIEAVQAAGSDDPPRGRAQCWMSTEHGHADMPLDKRADVVDKCIAQKMQGK